MKRRVLLFLSCCAMCAAVGWGLPPGIAHAAPLPAKPVLLPGPDRPLTVRAGQGCGWDYACAPEPGFERRFRPRPGQVYIHNNYGPVNIYEGRSRTPEPREEPVDASACGGDPCRGGMGCGGYPCREKCGAFCWWRRFKQGYCGHGCWAYREQARIEAEEHEERREENEDWRERDRGLDYPPPAHRQDRARPGHFRRAWREDAPHRDERSSPGGLGPRERFEGPRYPANCTYGGC